MDVVAAIHTGDIESLRGMLSEKPELATARLDGHRTLLHVAADWPGHFPRGAESVKLLAAHGANVSAAFVGGRHAETPLHWAASSDDIDVLDALLDVGADIEAPGSIIDGGSALSDAVAFAQWRAARRLVERGARTTIWHAAALGLLPRVAEYCANSPAPSADEITNAFWNACRGGQRETAEYLLAFGADFNRVLHGGTTPLDAAIRSGAEDVVEWLRGLGARTRSK